MTHDLGNRQRIFTAAQGNGCNAVPGLLPLSNVKFGLLQGRPPGVTPQVGGIYHSPIWAAKEVIPFELVVNLLLLFEGIVHDRDQFIGSPAIPVLGFSLDDFCIFIKRHRAPDVKEGS